MSYENIARKDLAIEFMENELKPSVLVDIYNMHAKRHRHEQFYPNDECTICDLISTEGKTPVEIWNNLGGRDYDENADYIKWSESTGYLECFYDSDVEDEITFSELVEEFDEWCEENDNEEFFYYIIDQLDDMKEHLPDGFLDWFKDERDSHESWIDIEDLIDEFDNYKEEMEDENE